ncbi:MAG: fructosamine kinase family protein [Bacillota bacterium]
MTLLDQLFNKMNVNTHIIQTTPLSGGQINDAYHVKTIDGDYFLKYNPNVSPDFFAFERDGLERIKATDTIKVPDVYGMTDNALLLEWIDSGHHPQASRQLGEQLAALHSIQQSHYGLDGDGYIGELHQPNRLTTNWLDYYKNDRLMTQRHLGIKQQRLSGLRLKRLDDCLMRLDQYIDPSPGASLLHGDLWHGNYLSTKTGTPVLIDPAICFGDRDFELAYTELFGGFDQDFYDAYYNIIPQRNNYSDVLPLYQLFYLLVHFNIFGESYGPHVDRILKRYSRM